MNEERSHGPKSGRSRLIGFTLALAAFLAIAGFYLYAEHRAHLFGALPWLLLVACPLLHLLHGHGRHGGGRGGWQ